MFLEISIQNLKLEERNQREREIERKRPRMREPKIEVDKSREIQRDPGERQKVKDTNKYFFLLTLKISSYITDRIIHRK